ncbi:hypothetical protein B0H17DRAFT_1193306 [Mycena rosella]|uniref:Uncharacterized protein n=1 Tax=Mycena rosella TaxID=1033263 RepID=A0AAD7M7F8_MYCRO|nr:hypothetical protein B0H17DRAFT_1193306 [Mycena rosella]
MASLPIRSRLPILATAKGSGAQPLTLFARPIQLFVVYICAWPSAVCEAQSHSGPLINRSPPAALALAEQADTAAVATVNINRTNACPDSAPRTLPRPPTQPSSPAALDRESGRRIEICSYSYSYSYSDLDRAADRPAHRSAPSSSCASASGFCVGWDAVPSDVDAACAPRLGCEYLAQARGAVRACARAASESGSIHSDPLINRLGRRPHGRRILTPTQQAGRRIDRRRSSRAGCVSRFSFSFAPNLNPNPNPNPTPRPSRPRAAHAPTAANAAVVSPLRWIRDQDVRLKYKACSCSYSYSYSNSYLVRVRAARAPAVSLAETKFNLSARARLSARTPNALRTAPALRIDRPSILCASASGFCDSARGQVGRGAPRRRRGMRPPRHPPRCPGRSCVRPSRVRFNPFRPPHNPSPLPTNANAPGSAPAAGACSNSNPPGWPPHLHETLRARFAFAFGAVHHRPCTSTPFPARWSPAAAVLPCALPPSPLPRSLPSSDKIYVYACAQLHSAHRDPRPPRSAHVVSVSPSPSIGAASRAGRLHSRRRAPHFHFRASYILLRTDASNKIFDVDADVDADAGLASHFAFCRARRRAARRGRLLRRA